jgi:uncharacterized protein DUF4920
MKTFSSLFLVLLLLAAAPALRAEETAYGEALTAGETLKISTILARSDDYVGKRVRVEGRVADVCPMKGCWMELEESPQAKIRVKVEDGVIVFPVSAKGKAAAAEGILESIPLTRERYAAWLEHEAEERGQTFDPATVGDGPYRILQIRGTGAKISGP